MTQQATSPTVSPASLSSPSASAKSATPAASPAATQHTSRKRPRSDLSPEEKREARAHRNRIAAQNSRDKRKLQFNSLEQRVIDLEDENRHLRDALATSQPNLVFNSANGVTEQDKQRERENQELRERIKVLEQGWSSVVQALTAAGQAIPSLGLPPALTTAQPQDQKKMAPMTIVLNSRAQSPSATSSVSSDEDRPASPAATSITTSPSATFSSLTAPTNVDDSTRHLARMANTSVDTLISVQEVPLQRVESSSTRTFSRTTCSTPIPTSTPPISSPSLRFNSNNNCKPINNNNKIVRRRHRQIPRSMLGCKTSCNQSRLLPQLQRRRLLFLLLLRSISKTRPPPPSKS